MAMNVQSKLICAGIGFSMMMQNFSFFLGFWDLYLKLGLETQKEECGGLAWWLGYDAVVCAMETVFACGMMLGAWWDGSRVLWWIFFVLHLVDAVPGYTVATIFLGKTIYSPDAVACADHHPSIGRAASAAWLCQAAFYVFYCCFMAGQFYMVVIRKDDEQGPFLEEKDNDKLVIFGNGLMMMVQNFSFAITYWGLYTGFSTEDESCHGTWWWLGFSAIVCAIETTFAGGMMFGGWIDGSKVIWWIFFVLHLIDAVPGYTVGVVRLGMTIKSADGEKCAEADPGVASMTYNVWCVQAMFYVFYCCNMVGQLYMVVVKEKKDSSRGYAVAPRD